jgi:hypothetical protein
LNARPNWRVVIPLGIVIGVVATLALWAVTRDDGSDASSDNRQTLGPRLDPGAAVDPSALWLFGFDTVRVDPVTLDRARALGTSAFGAAAARGADVFFYEPSTAQVGRLDARTSRFTVAKPVAAWPAPDARGTVAGTGRELWIVTGPGAVARVDPDRLQVREARHLDAPGATTTLVAASARDAVALSVTPSAALLQQVGAPSAPPRSFPAGDPAAGGTALGIARDGTTTWILRSAGATAVPDVGEPSRVVLPASAGPLRAATALSDDLWVLAGNGATVYRFEPDRAAPTATVPLLRRPRTTFREPVDLAAGDGAVFAMLPARTEPDRHDAVVVRLDAARARVAESLTLPSSFFAGAVAVTR